MHGRVRQTDSAGLYRDGGYGSPAGQCAELRIPPGADNAFDSLTDRDDVRVAVLTGTGRMFSAGADMKERPDPDHPGEYWHFNRLARECFNAIAECAKPVIAAVNGPALGAGLGLAASCDIILCSDNAQLGMPEIDVGLAGGAAMLQTLFGRSRARRMFSTGWRVPADEL